MPLAIEERETVISYYQPDKEAVITTSDQTVWTKLDNMGIQYRMIAKQGGKVVEREYIVPRRCVSFRNPKKGKRIYTEAQRKVLSERARKNFARPQSKGGKET